MNATGIEWTDYTLNWKVGCRGGCSYCYARDFARRSKCPKCREFVPHWHMERLEKVPGPKWAANFRSKHGYPPSVFIGSMCDLWDIQTDEDRQNLERVMEFIDSRRDITWLTLTKKPEGYGEVKLPENLWCGVTITDEQSWMTRYEGPNGLLANIDRRGWGYFISMEPLLGRFKPCLCLRPAGAEEKDPRACFDNIPLIIIGPRTRSKDPVTKLEWAKGILRECDGSGVAVFLKPSCKLIGFTDAEIAARQQLPWRREGA